MRLTGKGLAGAHRTHESSKARTQSQVCLTPNCVLHTPTLTFFVTEYNPRHDSKPCMPASPSPKTDKITWQVLIYLALCVSKSHQQTTLATFTTLDICNHYDNQRVQGQPIHEDAKVDCKVWSFLSMFCSCGNSTPLFSTQESMFECNVCESFDSKNNPDAAPTYKEGQSFTHSSVSSSISNKLHTTRITSLVHPTPQMRPWT